MTPPRSSAGITLLAVMVALALMIAVLLAMLTVWWQERAREKQFELLWVGGAFSEAHNKSVQRQERWHWSPES